MRLGLIKAYVPSTHIPVKLAEANERAVHASMTWSMDQNLAAIALRRSWCAGCLPLVQELPDVLTWAANSSQSSAPTITNNAVHGNKHATQLIYERDKEVSRLHLPYTTNLREDLASNVIVEDVMHEWQCFISGHK